MRILRGQNNKPASVGLIQERMLDKSSNASRLIDKLLAKKLVDRNICIEDRRQVDIRIIQKGLALLQEIDPLIVELDNQFKTINEEQAKMMGDLLDQLRG